MGVVYEARGLPAGTAGRLQGPRAVAGRERAVPRAIRPRVSARGLARPPQRDPDLRGRRGSDGAPLHRDAARREGSDLRDAASRTRERLEPAAGDRIIVEQVGGRARRGARSRASSTATSSPANVLLLGRRSSEPGEHVYLSDFGLARLGRRRRCATTDGALFRGRPNTRRRSRSQRAAPRRAATSTRSACVLSECLAGEPPFRPEPPARDPLGAPERTAAAPLRHVSRVPGPRSTRFWQPRSPSRRPSAPRPAVSWRRGCAPRSAWGRSALDQATSASLAAGVRRPGRRDGAEPRGRDRRASRLDGHCSGGAGDLDVRTGPAGADPWATAAPARARAARRAACRSRPTRPATSTSGEEGSLTRPPDRPGRHDRDPLRERPRSPRRSTSRSGPTAPSSSLIPDRPGLRRVDRRGVISTVVGTGEAGILADSGRTISRDLCGRPLGFAFDPKGAVHVACSNANRVVRVEPGRVVHDGRRIERERRLPATAGVPQTPGSMAPSRSPSTAPATFTSPTPETTAFARSIRPGSSPRSPAPAVQGDLGRRLSRVVCRPVDAGRRRSRRARADVYVLELGVSRIRKIDRNGIMTTSRGTGRAQFLGSGAPAGHGSPSARRSARGRPATAPFSSPIGTTIGYAEVTGNGETERG